MNSQQWTFKRDDSFYFDDGSCILRVEDTLFNVHRSILSRDSSSFGSMFALPQGGKAVEGASDENPVVLAGDTVMEFKHFLWSLYAMPSEIAAVSSGFGDLTLLIDIAQIANKYTFKSVETWALDAAYGRVAQTQQHLQDVPASPVLPTFQQPKPTPLDIPMDQFTRLLRLSQICDHERLLSTLVSILAQLTKGSVQYAFKSMAIADELDIPSLRGVSYLEILQKTTIDKWSMPGFVRGDVHIGQSAGLEKEGSSPEDLPALTSEQRTRLLAGYYRLSRFWERLRAAPPDFDHALACGATWHQHGCTLSWVEFWKERARSETVINLGVADVLGKLRHIQKEYVRLGNTTYMHHECRESAKKCLAETIKNTEDNLSEFFSDPL